MVARSAKTDRQVARVGHHQHWHASRCHKNRSDVVRLQYCILQPKSVQMRFKQDRAGCSFAPLLQSLPSAGHCTTPSEGSELICPPLRLQPRLFIACWRITLPQSMTHVDNIVNPDSAAIGIHESERTRYAEHCSLAEASMDAGAQNKQSEKR